MCSYHFLRAWYIGSYTMKAKPIRTLELHYPMIQFLINANIQFALLFYHCKSHPVSRASFCLLLDQREEKEVLPESCQAFEVTEY